jgi:NAD(P)-dependent dehydrogenase (short-subunit alcohol dehydrogenase family)
MEPRNRVALVTGAGSGIGKASALALLREGYCVVLAGRRVETLEATAAESGAGERAFVFVADVSDAVAVAGLFAATKEKFGRLDVLFNNAGLASPGLPIDELSIDRWKALVDTNLTGPFLCTREAFLMMKHQNPQGGRIINNGSISSQTPRPNSAPYTATKHAITGLTKSTSLDGRKYNIACGQIDIGNALTDMASPVTKGVPQADGSIKVEPVMDVENVAKVVVQMASLPLEANIQFVTVVATNMPFLGRG